MPREYEQCQICKDWGWTDRHVCDPVWLVIHSEYDDEDDPKEVHADDTESAALKYAEDRFSDWDHPNEVEIWARKTKDDAWEKFIITVEVVPSFSAERKE